MARSSSSARLVAALALVVLSAIGAHAACTTSLCTQCKLATGNNINCERCQSQRCVDCIKNAGVTYKQFCVDTPAPGASACTSSDCVTCLINAAPAREALCVESGCNSNRCWQCIPSAPTGDVVYGSVVADAATFCKTCTTDTCVGCLKQPFRDVTNTATYDLKGVSYKQNCYTCTSQRCIDCLNEATYQFVQGTWDENRCLDSWCTSELCYSCLKRVRGSAQISGSAAFFDNEGLCNKCQTDDCVKCLAYYSGVSITDPTQSVGNIADGSKCTDYNNKQWVTPTVGKKMLL